MRIRRIHLIMSQQIGVCRDVSPFRRRGTLARAKVTKARWGTFDVPQTPDDRLLRGTAVPLAGEGIPPEDEGTRGRDGERHRASHCPHILSHTLNILIFFRFFGKVFFRKY